MSYNNHPQQNMTDAQLTIQKQKMVKLPFGTGTLDVFENILNDLKAKNIEVNVSIINSRFFNLMKDDIHQEIVIIPNGIQFVSQIWKDTNRIIFSPYIEDWYIIPKVQWYEQQDIKGINLNNYHVMSEI